MNLANVASDQENEPPQKVTWTNVTAKGRTALKKVQSAIANQNSEEMFKKEIIEALQPVFAEVYSVVKTNVQGYEEFLDQFPALHSLKNPVWAKMFDEVAFNASNVPNGDLKKQMTDMEVKLKAIDRNMPSIQDFIKVIFFTHFQITLLESRHKKFRFLIYFLRLWWKRQKRAPSGRMMNLFKSEAWR